MKRIVEDDSSTRDIVTAMRARPDDPFAAARVLASINAGRRLRRRLRVVPVLAALVLGLLVSAASAMVWHATHRPAAVNAPPARSIAIPPPALPVESAPTTAPIAQPAVVPPPKHAHHAVLAEPIQPAHPAELAVELPEPHTEESRLLREAFHALHDQADSTLALSRVDEYLARFPHGELVEEALEIALDTATDDLPRAQRYARIYVARFPDGRHVARAHALLEE